MKMDAESFGIGMKRLKASYPAANVDEMTSAAFAEALSDYDGRDLIAASKVIVRTSKFFPSIAELIEVIEDCAKQRFERQDSERRAKQIAEVSSAPDTGEARRKFQDLVRGFRELAPRPHVNVAARVDELRRQAAELGAGAAS